jgi:ribulose-5-phosphate 4-epimerase/fuculose-1-phosphate aldolase
MAIELEEVKLQVAQANRVLSSVGLARGVTAALGHASMRVSSQPDRFVVKGREYALDALAVMRAADMVVCDTEQRDGIWNYRVSEADRTATTQGQAP